MDHVASPGIVWTILGIAGDIIFYGRFYIQWIASERAQRSVIPIAFWYMSSIGSVALMLYAFAIQSPLGALGQSLNIVIYSRNLIHIWRERGRLSKALNIAVHATVAILALVAVGLMLWTWWREYELSALRTSEQTQQAWLWLAVGFVGQLLFAGRFILQWIATERQKRSVIPPLFWYLSVAAATLQVSCFIQRAEWIFAMGMLATLLIYARNIWFIRTKRETSWNID